MIYTDTASERMVMHGVHTRPSPLGSWLKSALLHLVSAPTQAPPLRDRVREAAELRVWATEVRQTDPRFAADLFAAADRHEVMGS